MALIEVKNLTKTYGDTRTVDGISFEVHEGEIFGFLGPNGAGKITTVEIIESEACRLAPHHFIAMGG